MSNTEKRGNIGISDVRKDNDGNITSAKLEYVSMDLQGEICPYCGNSADWVENKAVYGRNFGRSYMIWLCKPCNAYVGCHNNTRKPLGTIANAQLRKERQATHKVIDPIWLCKKDRRKARTELYKMISDHFGYEVHVGSSDERECRQIREFVELNQEALEITLN